MRSSLVVDNSLRVSPSGAGNQGQLGEARRVCVRKEILITIFYVMKQSGKFKRQFHATTEALGVHLPEGPRHSFRQPSAERGADAVAQLDSIDGGS